MLPKSKKMLFTALASVSMLFSGSIVAQDKGLISIIVNDMSNPYWQTEGKIAERTAKELGYEANVSSHVGDTNTESNQVDTAITNGAKAIILDPANVDGSIGAVRRAVEADIPVFIINAEINQQGLAKVQLVSNNAQGAALGAQEWATQLGGEGSYIELEGPPSDNNAATRSNGYETVLSQYPDLNLVASDIANWSRTEGRNKMQSMLRSHPDIRGVISGNDEMALGAIVALKQEGRLDDVLVGGFDGSPDAVDAVRSGELAYTVLQPVAVFAEDAVKIADHYINTGETGLDSEKQLYDCILITPDNVDNYTSPFVLEE
ncbi:MULTISPECIES: D-ribose ABC transporter substrate-binding protein [unclassified Halomonas]|uniref:D-ribose ABC transporter substrate-binding protein n=1 Tax=unclassified Halomonas TaxID=2609666 RepID=UPI0007D9CA48|nr:MULTISPECIES: D-ribose ABC transporter substrate-binding protein [unclassified Halomonas]MBT2787718.1 D-ribose ABC transporter substrate-binding protein [Halomonas sp. ISL-106]MBT2796921.1 D-ribose ABC transporter substrate-binding protein [Halomonas sp. ISL-104]OAL61475.1 D-ribose ABC transporter substrate-binding protein [Halomonas sp. ALS9]